jgi:hypothetical protein
LECAGRKKPSRDDEGKATSHYNTGLTSVERQDIRRVADGMKTITVASHNNVDHTEFVPKPAPEFARAGHAGLGQFARAHGRRVAVALVPAAHTMPLASQYISRSTTIGSGSPVDAARGADIHAAPAIGDDAADVVAPETVDA